MEYKCLIRYPRVSISPNFQRLFKRQCCKINVCRVSKILSPFIKRPNKNYSSMPEKTQTSNCATASPFAPPGSPSTLFTALGQTLTLRAVSPRLTLPSGFSVATGETSKKYRVGVGRGGCLPLLGPRVAEVAIS